MDLGDILDEIKSTSPTSSSKHSVEFGRGYWDRVLKGGHVDPNAHLMDRPCPPKDDTPGPVLVLTQYEAWWLEWRLKVHLRSQKMLEWIEMEEVIECLLMRIISGSTPVHWTEDSSSIRAAEFSKENSGASANVEQDSVSNISNVSIVQPKPPGTVMEPVQDILETSLTSEPES